MFEHKKLMDLETNGSNNCSTTSMLHKQVYDFKKSGYQFGIE